MQTNFFVKSHGLGNDYIVLDSESINFELNTNTIIKICDTHYGIGSDGILLKTASSNADFGIRIFNPDGSEAEKSGNGLRIFCKYLFDYGFTDKTIFTVETISNIITAKIIEIKNEKAQIVEIEMGKAEFVSSKIPVALNSPECINYKITILDKTFLINCVSIGNPHCVIYCDYIDENLAKKYGSIIEQHELFPNRINVQFAQVVSPTEVKIEIWERGAGYTFASGSSSCAVACMSYKLGYTSNEVAIQMPGGIINVSIDKDWNIQMIGNVREIASGILSTELIEDFS